VATIAIPPEKSLNPDARSRVNLPDGGFTRKFGPITDDLGDESIENN
jgi:hypothetical protein